MGDIIDVHNPIALDRCPVCDCRYDPDRGDIVHLTTMVSLRCHRCYITRGIPDQTYSLWLRENTDSHALDSSDPSR